MSNIEHFVEKYRIGFVQSAELQNSGYIKVEIPCLITRRGYDSNPYSADVLFKMQLDFLEENGFVLKSDKMGIYLENNEKNISNIRKLLENRKCRHIEFNLLDERIRSISNFSFENNSLSLLFPSTIDIGSIKSVAPDEDESWTSPGNSFLCSEMIRIIPRTSFICFCVKLSKRYPWVFSKK